MKNFAALPAVLHELRRAKQLTQAELADRLKVNRRTISTWENGKAYPDLVNLDKILNIYEIGISDLAIELEARQQPSRLGALLESVAVKAIRESQKQVRGAFDEE